MKIWHFWIGCIVLIWSGSACSTQEKDIADKADLKDSIAILENDTISLQFLLQGGILNNMHDKSSYLNPFSWENQNLEENQPIHDLVLQGQYVCLGRWGSPTPGEAKLGMPYDGELCNNTWKKNLSKNNRCIQLTCEAPLEGITVDREIAISVSDPLFKVVERYTNDLNIGRPLSIIQCCNFAAPFLDSASHVYSNATFGYSQVHDNTDSRREYTWPLADMDSIHELDLSGCEAIMDYTSWHIISDSIGWVTLENIRQNLLVGYVWKTSEFPWLNISQINKDGKPLLKRISFATTGIAGNLPVDQKLVSIFHGKRNFEFLDAKDNIQKTYYCFMIHLPEKYTKTQSISLNGDNIIIKTIVNGKIKEITLAM